MGAGKNRNIVTQNKDLTRVLWVGGTQAIESFHGLQLASDRVDFVCSDTAT